MQTIAPLDRLSFRILMVIAASTCLAYLAGCGGSSEGTGAPNSDTGSTPRQTQDHIPNYNPPTVWIEMIEEASFENYAALGRELLSRDRVRIVFPPTLDERFNAFAFIDRREVWINEPMFERYPSVIDQATIFLHELIHIDSGEVTHLGPWWSAQTKFHAFWTERASEIVSAAQPVE